MSSELLAFVGALSGGFLTNYIMYHLNISEQRKNLKNALLAEIKSIINLIEIRGHVKKLEEFIENYMQKLEAFIRGDRTNYEPFRFRADHSYIQVYKNNLHLIGGLEDAGIFVDFYSKVMAFIDDIYTVSERFDKKREILEKKYFTDMLALLKNIVESGNKIINKNNISYVLDIEFFRKDGDKSA
jgi:hypothetical protein